jgi:Protein of unknown function (DUF3352)
MNKLLKSGILASTFGLLLYASSAKAEGLNNTRKYQPPSVEITTKVNSDFIVSKSTISFLESKLRLAANSPKVNSEQLNNVIIPNQENSIGNFFPADSSLVALINTKIETWQSLNRFQLFNLVQQSISQLLPNSTNLDYLKDIQSWIGDEIAVGFMPKVANTRATLQSNFIAIIPIRNETGLKSFLDILEKDKQRVKVREYQGVTIFEIITAPAKIPAPTNKTATKLPINNNNYLAVATLPGYVALSLNPKPIEQLIDSKAGKQLIIANNPQFQTFTQQNRDKVLFLMYQNPAKYLALVKDFANDPNLPISLPAFQALKPEQFEKYANINTTIRLQPEGLRLQIQTLLESGTADIKSANKPELGIISKMPAATYSASTGSNISLQWQTIVNLLGIIPEFKKGLADFRYFIKSSMDLDLDRDIIGWMDGEYGFFMFPSKGGLFSLISPNFNLGIGLAVKTSNRNAAEKTLNKFKQALTNIGAGEIFAKDTNIKGQPVTSWESKAAAKSLFAYSWVDENTLIFTSGLDPISNLVPKPQVPLSSTYNFSTATNSLPYPNEGYFYVNMGSSLSWIYSFIPQEYQNNQFVQGFKQAVGSVYSLSATTSQTTEQEKFDMLIVLAPTRRK